MEESYDEEGRGPTTKESTNVRFVVERSSEKDHKSSIHLKVQIVMSCTARIEGS
jgi:hypothetical protein